MKYLCKKLFFFSVRHRWILRGALLLIIVGSIWGIMQNKYSADMRLLLPSDSRSAKNLNAVINSGMANKVTFYFSRKDGKELDNVQDMETIQLFSNELKCISGITQVVCTPLSSQEVLYRDFVRYYPLLYPPVQLPQQENLASKLRENFKNLSMNPIAGSLQYQYDPFHWTTQYFLKLENILRISRLRFYAGNKSFIFSQDRKICMVMVYTDIAATDFAQSTVLINDLHSVARNLPEHLECNFFSPHMHMLENAKIMKTDLHIFAFFTLLIFGAVFAFVYKFDWHGIVIPVIASIGGLIAAAAMGVFFDTILLFTIAMGGILIGIAGDYGIHLYVASCTSRKVQKGIELYPKLFIAFLTTEITFLCFAFSGVPAFRQFGLYSSLTLLFSFLLLLFLLPGWLFFGKHRNRTGIDFFHLMHLQNISFKHVWIALIILLAFLVGLYNAKLDTDIRKFDISYSTIMKKEKVLQSKFSQGATPYILFYSSDTFDDVLKKSREDKLALQKKFPEIDLITPSDFFLPEAEQKENLRLWKAYIRSGEWGRYKNEFFRKVSQYGIEKDYFSYLFSEIERSILSPPTGHPKLLNLAYKNMLGETFTNWTGIGMVNRSSICGAELEKNTSAVMFEEEAFIKQLFEDILGDLPFVLPFAAVFVFLIVLLGLRSLTKSCLAFLPVVTCLICIGGIHGLLNQEITLAVVVAGIITIGISIDYGVLLVSSKMNHHIFNAITFSAITTAAGGMTVLFTNHPMLRNAGLTIVVGILSACFFSFFLLYPILNMKNINFNKVTAGFIFWLACLGISGCTAFPQAKELPLSPGAKASECKFPSILAGEFQGSLLLDYKLNQVAFLIAGKLSADGTGDFYGFSPGGVKLFTLQGKGYKLEKFNWFKGIVPEKKQEDISRFLYRSISSRLYVPEELNEFESKESSSTSTILTGKISGGDKITCFYADKDCIEVRREYFGNGTYWVIKHCQQLQETDTAYLFADSCFFQAYIKMNFL